MQPSPPVRRADGSGTTFIFTNYLSKVNAEWKAKVGEGTAVNWPTGAGGKGNEGVAAFVGRLPKARIGYVEYAYVKQNKMNVRPAAKRGRQASCRLTTSTFKAAAAGADWTKSFYQILTNQPGKDAWPITSATFILMHKSAGQAGPGCQRPEVLRLGLQATATSTGRRAGLRAAARYCEGHDRASRGARSRTLPARLSACK